MLLAPQILWHADQDDGHETSVSLEMCLYRKMAFCFKSIQSSLGEEHAADNLLVVQISANTQLVIKADVLKVN